MKNPTIHIPATQVRILSLLLTPPRYSFEVTFHRDLAAVKALKARGWLEARENLYGPYVLTTTGKAAALLAAQAYDLAERFSPQRVGSRRGNP
jgi:hypothetical protein